MFNRNTHFGNAGIASTRRRPFTMESLERRELLAADLPLADVIVEASEPTLPLCMTFQDFMSLLRNEIPTETGELPEFSMDELASFGAKESPVDISSASEDLISSRDVSDIADPASDTIRPLFGDFNTDGQLGLVDVDMLVGAIVARNESADFDLTGDGLTNREDLDHWREIAGAVNLGLGRAYGPADVNLDGVIDGSDYGILSVNRYLYVAAWSAGDLDADGAVGPADFAIWNTHKFTTATVPPTSPTGPIAAGLDIEPIHLLGDFNVDGRLGLEDIDLLVASIASGRGSATFDLTSDGLIGSEDLDAWRRAGGSTNLGFGMQYEPGDANLDGLVDGLDFGIWNANKHTTVAAWSRGDFNADGAVNDDDLAIWRVNQFTHASGGMVLRAADTAIVPGSVRGDFDGDGQLGLADVDMLVQAIVEPGSRESLDYDLNSDGDVSREDLDTWRALGGPLNLGTGREYLPGDANLDGLVDGSDFGIWNMNKFSDDPRWSAGDFDADGWVTSADLSLWSAFRMQSPPSGDVPSEDPFLADDADLESQNARSADLESLVVIPESTESVDDVSPTDHAPAVMPPLSETRDVRATEESRDRTVAVARVDATPTRTAPRGFLSEDGRGAEKRRRAVDSLFAAFVGQTASES